MSTAKSSRFGIQLRSVREIAAACIVLADADMHDVGVDLKKNQIFVNTYDFEEASRIIKKYREAVYDTTGIDFVERRAA